MEYDKANWTERNIFIFCELYVQEIHAGNCPFGHMKNIGYKNIARKFYEKTKLNHKVKQFKNRYTACRVLWNFYDEGMKDTCLGKTPDGMFIATTKWWKDHTEGKAECKKFMRGIPYYIDYLREMFQGITVDGQSSCIPGQGNEVAVDDEAAADEEEEEEGEAADPTSPMSPISSGSRKRGSSTTDSATSPNKKTKSPMVSAFNRFIHTFHAGSKEEAKTIEGLNKKRQEERARREEQKQIEEQLQAEEIDDCLRMTVECGADESSTEYYMAIKLFRDKYNRNIFKKFKTNEGKMGWLKFMRDEGN